MPNNLQPGMRNIQQDVYMTRLLTEMVESDDMLRPQSTRAFNGTWADKPYDFPNLYINLPVRFWSPDAMSTYSNDQNNRFLQRYGKPIPNNTR